MVACICTCMLIQWSSMISSDQPCSNILEMCARGSCLHKHKTMGYQHPASGGYVFMRSEVCGGSLSWIETGIDVKMWYYAES